VLPWGSQSITRVLFSATASEAPRFTAVVVFPTPPFWFEIAMVRAKHSPSEIEPKSTESPVRMQDVSRETNAKVAVRVQGNGVPRGTSLRPFLRDWRPYEDVTSLRARNTCRGVPFPL
jgi:hypothetical protein